MRIKKSVYRGFTLIELMITLSIASILLSVAVPSYRSFTQDSLLITQSNSFYFALALAKSEAIKRNTRITICPSTNGTNCTASNIWSNGWVVFVDNNNSRTIDVGEEILQVSYAFSGGNTLKASLAGTIMFRPDGFSPGSAATFSLCDDRGSNYSKTIVLSNQGRFRTETGNGSCS